jgi:DNA-binding response OmpR family regulator
MVEYRGNIVIVEDDAGLNQALTRLLQAAGFETTGFNTADAALHSTVVASADCLVLDVHLADMTGFELHRRLGELGHTPPVIVITAHDDSHSRRQAHTIGAADYLTKPFAGRTLVAAISRIVSARQT